MCSISGSVQSLSSSSSKGSLNSSRCAISHESLSSSRSSMSHNKHCERNETNFRELHQRVNSILQGISSTSTPLKILTSQGMSLQKSTSKDSLSISSVSPPRSPSPDKSFNTDNTRRFHSDFDEMNDRVSLHPDSLSLPLKNFRFGNETNTSLSPITEGIPSRCHSVNKGVSAAVSDESVAADSGVFDSSMENLRRQSSMRSTRQNSDDDGAEIPQIKIGLGYVEEKEQLLVYIDEAYSLQLLCPYEGFGAKISLRILQHSSDRLTSETTDICKNLQRAVFSQRFHYSLPMVNMKYCLNIFL